MLIELDKKGFLEEVASSGIPCVLLVGVRTCSLCALAKERLLNYDEQPELARSLRVDFVPSIAAMVGRDVLCLAKGVPDEEGYRAMLREFEKLRGVFPSWRVQVASLLRAAWRLLRSLRLSAARRARLKKCGQCVFRAGARCSACGCFVRAKAAVVEETCPKGFWGVTP
jgi:hypothetical protein